MVKQVLESSKKWNESNLDSWNDDYYKKTFNGFRLRSREKGVLKMLDRIKLPAKSKVLELGYGAGVTSAKIVQRGYSLTGIDISKKFKDIAMDNCEKVCKNKSMYNFLVGNAEKLDFSDNSFDCVIGIGFLHYLEFPKKCIDECFRVLKPGGYLIIAQRNMYGISSLDGPFKLLRTLVYLITQRKYELRITKEKVKKNAFSYWRLKKLINKSGFKIVGSIGAGFLSKKYKIMPKFTRRVDIWLQNLNNKILNRYANSQVFLAHKE